MDPYNYQTKPEDYNKVVKSIKDDLKRDFEKYEQRQLSDSEFQEMYKDYVDCSNLTLQDYFKLRKYV